MEVLKSFLFKLLTPLFNWLTAPEKKPDSKKKEVIEKRPAPIPMPSPVTQYNLLDAPKILQPTLTPLRDKRHFKGRFNGRLNHVFKALGRTKLVNCYDICEACNIPINIATAALKHLYDEGHCERLKITVDIPKAFLKSGKTKKHTIWHYRLKDKEHDKATAD